LPYVSRGKPRGIKPDFANKKLVGAMAGDVVDADVRDYAHKAGFYILELTGESVTLIKPPESFVAKEW
jgi:hypothetical protein